MKEIKLTQSKVTIVDDDDFKRFGHLRWHYSHGRAVRRFGKYTREKQGYRGSVWLHREIMGNPHNLKVDHINGNPLDNRKENLRLCTQSQNLMNARKWKKPTSSKYKGVHYAKNASTPRKWYAYIGTTRTGKRKRLGNFATEKEAALAYNKAAQELYGNFALLNIVD